MAFRFKRGESVVRGFFRMLRESIEDIMNELDGKADDEAVHRARRGLRRTRALIALVHGEIEPDELNRENHVLRDAGRQLAPARDSAVLLAALDRFAGVTSETIELVPRLERILSRQKQSALASEPVAQVAAELQDCLGRMERWSLRHKGWRVLKSGFQRSYRRARNAFLESVASPSLESIHEWRKRTKDLVFQLKLIGGGKRSGLRGLRRGFKEITSCLGEDHDFAMLESWLGEEKLRTGVDREALKTLRLALRTRRKLLQERAFRIAEDVFDCKPHAFVRHLHQAWKQRRHSC